MPGPSKFGSRRSCTCIGLHVPIAAVMLLTALRGAAGTCLTTRKRFSGVTLNLFGIHWGEDLLLDGVKRWENETGARIQWTRVTGMTELEEQITDDLNGANVYDGYICTNKMVPRWASRGWLADLTEAVRDPLLGWQEILPVFRQTIAVYGKSVVSIPWDGDVFLMYYRRDLADRDGWSAPRTWEDFVEIAERYDGDDLNNDGQPDYGACICSDPSRGSSFYHWITPYLTMVQHSGTTQGAFLHLSQEGIRTLVDNEAFRRTVQILRRAQGTYPIGHNSERARQDFADGRCAIYYTWPSGGAWSIQRSADGQFPYMHGRLGVAPLPGSPEVLDRSANKLVPCTPSVCPYAREPKTGEYDGINRIAWYANGGMGTIINNASEPLRKEAMVHFFLWYAAHLDVSSSMIYNPFRTSHFDVADYIASGWDADDAAQFVLAEKTTLLGPFADNAVIDFRVPFATDFFHRYNERYPDLLNGSGTLDDTIAAIEDRVQEFIDVDFSASIANPQLPGSLELERIYREGLGLVMRPLTQLCGPGTGYVETNSAHHTGECLKCKPGAYSPGGVNQKCIPCGAGYMANRTGSAQCETCGSGFYAPKPEPGAAAGAVHCFTCPENTAPGPKGQAMCKCARGYFGPGGTSCTKCPGGMTTLAPDARELADCSCDAGEYMPLDPPVCQPCPEGLTCGFGSKESNIPTRSQTFESAVGTYPQVSEHYYTSYDQPLQAYRCLSHFSCLGGRPESCAAHSEGIACTCMMGYFDDDGRCSQCEAMFRFRPLYPSMLLTLGPLGAFLLHQLSFNDIQDWGSAKEGLKLSVQLAFMVTQTAGVLSILATVTEDSASPLLKTQSFASSFVNPFRFLRVECGDLFHFPARFVAMIMMPAVCAMLFVIAYFVSKCVPRWAMRADVSFCCYGSIFFALYITIAAQMFSLFQCYQHPNGRYTLISAPSVLCYDTTWYALCAIDVLAILVYGFIPISMVAYLVRSTSSKMVVESYRMKFKFLLKKFRPSHVWWSLVILAKGIWMSLAFGLTHDFLCVCVLLFVGFLLYSAGTAYCQPWRIAEINYLDVAAHFFVALEVFCITTQTGASSSPQTLMELMDFNAALLFVSLGLVVVTLLWFVVQVLSPPQSLQKQRASRTDLANDLQRVATFLSEDAGSIRKVLITSMTSRDLMTLHKFVNAGRTLQRRSLRKPQSDSVGRRWSDMSLVSNMRSSMRQSVTSNTRASVKPPAPP